jgi:hypothetical protein
MRWLTGFILLIATKGFGGGSAGGGNPPAMEIDHARLMELQAGTLAGDFIRVKRPGESPIYMKPIKESIREFSLTAQALPSGEETLFRASSGFQVFGNGMSDSMARMIGSSVPGILPIVPGDFAVGLRPTVEVVPRCSLNDTAIQLTID